MAGRRDQTVPTPTLVHHRLTTLLVVCAVVFLGAGDTSAQLPTSTKGAANAIQITKVANRNQVVRGDIVTYTVSVTNNSGRDFPAGGPSGGVLFQDTPPAGFRYVTGSARIETPGGSITVAPPPNRRATSNALVFGVEVGLAQPAGIPFLNGQTLRLTYQLRVGTRVKSEKVYTNKVFLRTPSGEALTPDTFVNVRVMADPEFDMGAVLGRVFCDTDGDGVLDPGEDGVGGVRIYGDHGWKSVSDRLGKWHLRRMRPGNHLVKLDENSLPPGSKVVGPVKHIIYVTPGLVVKRDFGVTCSFKEVSPRRVVRPRKALSKGGDEVVVPTEPLADIVTVGGELDSLSIAVDGKRLAPFSVDMTLSGPTGSGENNFRNGTRNIAWAPGALTDPFVFGIRSRGGPLAKSWRFQVFRVDGGREQLVREKVGRGQPPKSLKWDGTDATGVLSVLVRGGLYHARMAMADGTGNVAISQPAVFGVSYGSNVQPVVIKALRGRKLFSKTMAPGRALSKELRKLRKAFKEYPGARLLIGVHSGDSGMPDVDMGRTRRGAFQTKMLAQKVLGVLPNQVLSIGYGSTQPLRPVISKRDNEFNRRVELTVLPRERPQQLQAPPVRDAKPQVLVQGLPTELGTLASYARSVTRPQNGRLALALTNAKGQRRLAVVVVDASVVAPKTKKKAAPPKKAPAKRPKPKDPKIITDPLKSGDAKSKKADDRGELTVDATMRKPEPKATGKKKAPKAPAVGAARASKPRLSLKKAPKKDGDTKKASTMATDPLRRFGGDALRKAIGAKSVLLDELNRGMPVTAGKLKVKLPPKGLKINTKRLFLPGTTHPDNRITVNGQKVHVGPSGVFSTTVPLPIGKSTLLIESTDKAGNKAKIEWPVEVSKSEFFLMAIADGVLGHKGAKLAEREQFHQFETGDIFLAGRGALYLKGRVSGLGIAKDLFITAHVDSTKNEAFNAFYEQVIDPARDYYVFGDASQEDQDVRARGPLYLLVELDKSKLTVGNVRTDFQGVSLFRYNRSFYGIHLDFNESFAEGWDTRVKAFVTDDQSRMARGHDEMRGTGGSLYYLSKKDIVKGSETLHVVVREMQTGMEMARHTLKRDQHYRIDYMDGRVFMRAPLPATFDSLFSLSGFQPFNGRDLMDGHEIWIVAEYESRDRSVGDNVSWGVQASQRIFKYVEVGGGYLREGRAGGDDYEHMGAHLKVDINPTSKAYLEFAQSLNSDGASRLTNDGGFTYRAVDRTGGEDYGWALKTGLSTHIGDLAGMGKDLDLTVKGWYQLMQPGFQALGNRQETGTEKWGGQILYRPTDKDLAVVRLDWTTALVPDDQFSTGFRAVKRNRYQLLYRHTEKDWRVGLEAGYGQHRDDQDGEVFDTGAVTVMGGYKIIPELELTLSQEILIGGDDKELGPDYFSRTATTVGATWQLDEDIALMLAQELRWNGDNHTRFGLRTKLSPTANLYLEERIRTDDETGRLIGATVVGAEQLLPGGGRMYGEYRLDGGISGRANQAVFGIAKRFELAEGVRLTAAYERTQTLGAWEGVGARDVVSAGLEVLMADFIKYGGRYELRFDRAPGLNQMQSLLRNGLNLKIGDAVTVFGTANYTLTQDLTTRKVKAEHLDSSLAVVVRPLELDWFTMGTTWKRTIRRNALQLEGFDKLGNVDRDERTITDLLSFTSIFEMPARLQLALRLAYRHTEERVTGLPESSTDYLISVLRLGFHLIENFDVAAEYRLLYTVDTDEIQHGALLEVSYNIFSYARIGVGFNFSSFSDNLMADLDEDASGFFVRLTGTY